ncbi:MAG: hypothetical protein DYG88_10215 [Chloroflexi bacterium CFX4]|nr:hypothetical protein [Chloroflexi bacterium CFX4]MDL1923252.1 hypothetical protein [Chloroflexi bacterium CFX3]
MFRKIALILCLVLLVLPHGALHADDSTDEARAIALAAAHPRLAAYLAEVPNWYALAYNPEAMRQIWRVQFYAANHAAIASADVHLDKGRVYWLEVDYSHASQATQRKGREAALNFAKNHPDVRELLGAASDRYEAWIEYEAWRGTWAIYMWYAGDVVQVVLRFNSPNPFDFAEPELVGITFPELLTVEAWVSARQAQAITLAAAASQTAAALREHAGWQAEATPEGTPSSAVWRVTFRHGERTIAQTWVDLAKGAILRAEIP